MGVFLTTCKCGNRYYCYSFNHVTVHRGQKCDECWKKEGINPDEFKCNCDLCNYKPVSYITTSEKTNEHG